MCARVSSCGRSLDRRELEPASCGGGWSAGRQASAMSMYAQGHNERLAAASLLTLSEPDTESQAVARIRLDDIRRATARRADDRP